MGKHARSSRKPRPGITAALAVAAAGAVTWPAPSAAAAPVTTPVHPDVVALAHAAVVQQAPERTYIVQPGDTLSGIAARLCGATADYPALVAANGIADANLIYAGQVLHIACGGGVVTTAVTHGPDVATTATAGMSGTLGCTQLERLWEDGGGSPAIAFTAAEVAMAESGGNQYATGAAGERGYWQINPDHGALSTYDPLGNAQAAVVISADGTNWTPWTTWTSGAYEGRC